jgi:glycosyltransferase involved in cell wall biosynthesis
MSNNQVASIISKSGCKKKVYDILTFNTHERYQTQLAKTGHNFYAFNADGMKEWITGHGDVPKNHYNLPKNSVYTGLDFDFILAQSKIGQMQAAHQINQMLSLPIVALEHTLPVQNWTGEQLLQMKQMTGDINVFISEYSAEQWKPMGSREVVLHSIDTELFKPQEGLERKQQVLSVVHSFIDRDYCCNYSGWQRITKPDEIKTRVVGDTPGLSKQSDSIQDLVSEYQSSQIFLNTSTLSPIPMALLEAMACGCAVVTTATCMIPEIIQDGVNGFISNDEEQLQSSIQNLLNDPGLAKKLGENARQTILEKFNEDSFVGNWNNIFNKAYGLKK